MDLSLPTFSLLVSLIGLSAVAGIVAVVCPTCFQRLAGIGGSWVDTDRWWAVLDQRVDIDRFVLQRPRLFGSIVIAASAYLGYLLYLKF
ncbi:hypothetical protein M4951_09590 [Blastopirellula sp. J2-11]|uniref:hypothetical protein n=1 Tax=Blastopirellula sp. J2-11 TaxID=2943192 RepID=UPI0021C5AFE1|nr:hypothetical protein [Blastopirellula sp. J2-11]UUO08556.1 hypothetical protein M4951_09590 [Blastopirellula sp. J2-11]